VSPNQQVLLANVIAAILILILRKEISRVLGGGCLGGLIMFVLMTYAIIMTLGAISHGILYLQK